MEALLHEWINPYYLQVLTLLGVYIVAALGLNLITGVTGLFSFGHAAYLSIGAYTAAIMTINFHAPFPASLLIGGFTAALAGVLVGFPSLRLTGDYFGIATLGFGEIIRVVFTNMDYVGGACGLAGIPRNTTFTAVLIIVVLAVWLSARLHNSRFGRALLAVREDEIAAECMGINTVWHKVAGFALGSFLGGVAGGLYAHLIQFIAPTDFGFVKSFELLTFVVIGGLGSIPGTILGTTLLTLAPELLRPIQDYRMMLYGALMVGMMIFRPLGLLGGVDLARCLRHVLRFRRKKSTVTS